MKVQKLTIKNIGKIASEVIALDKPLILFYGEIRQGKSTILNCVRWVCGGEFPADIIKHGETEAFVELAFDGGMIRREWYKAKDKTTKARSVVFVRNGRPVASPVSEIKRLLNPFLIDQDFLRNKSELERKQYFTELFAVDTTTLDTELFNNQKAASDLRSKIAGVGAIDLAKVEAVDISALKAELENIRSDYTEKKNALEVQLQNKSDLHETACRIIDTENEDARTKNSARQKKVDRIAAIDDEIAGMNRRIAALRAEMESISVPAEIALKVKPAPPDRASIQKKILDLQPDTSALETKIQNGAAQNVRAEQYKSNLARSKSKEADEAALSTLEKRGREIKLEKQSALKSISDKCGIDGLEFDDAGNFIYQGTTAGMISDSQIMRLSSELSALYPDGFGLDLIDRGESLGKSIFAFVDKARAEEKTILATIVGERPAKVPDDIGVFVVEDGKLV